MTRACRTCAAGLDHHLGHANGCPNKPTPAPVGSGRVFPRTPEGLEKAMRWLQQFDRTLTLMGVSTYTVLREAK